MKRIAKSVAGYDLLAVLPARLATTTWAQRVGNTPVKVPWLKLATLAAVCIAAVCVAAPRTMAEHTHLPLLTGAGALASTATVLRALGASALALSAYTLLRGRLLRFGLLAPVLVAITSYLSLSTVFLDWHVDDAAITYAYAENLVQGHGLVLHPAHAPEEAYSNLLWLLMLAAARLVGVDVALAAKVLGTAVGASVIALCFMCLRRSTGRVPGGAAQTLTIATLSTSPFVIWTVSGLEHGLQAAILLAMVWLAFDLDRNAVKLGALAAALILLRPEAPLVIAPLVLVLCLEQLRTGLAPRQVVVRVWPVAAIPIGALAALLVFRSSYFGDVWPNPYYAKASQATVLSVANPFGAGWSYIVTWLLQGCGFLLLVPLCLLKLPAAPPAVRVAVALLIGQLAFVVYAGGDWMGQWRFLSAPIPLLAFLVGYAVERASEARPLLTNRHAALAAVAVSLSLVPLLAGFRASPTTPYREVALVGQRFSSLAERLGIRAPLLAHHDAGGTSYRAGIALLDLGGLGDRVIAKHMDDAAFLRAYILRERRPDFVFGASEAFAAGVSRFHEAPEFARDYVRVVFGDPRLDAADLCHLRRDRLGGHGVIERAASGKETVAVAALLAAPP